jgi:hypothetical protein
MTVNSRTLARGRLPCSQDLYSGQRHTLPAGKLQLIEGVIDLHKDLFALARHRAKTFEGLLTRLVAKIAAYTCGQALNAGLGRPLRRVPYGGGPRGVSLLVPGTPLSIVGPGGMRNPASHVRYRSRIIRHVGRLGPRLKGSGCSSACSTKPRASSEASSHSSRFTCKLRLFRVEPRGFEPLTSAVQSQIHNVVVVRWSSESAANKHILSCELSCLFAAVHVGWCTTGVNRFQRNTSPTYP